MGNTHRARRAMLRRQTGKLAAATLVAGSAVVLSTPAAHAATTTFTVNSLAQAIDANIGDGICATAAAECTLLAATQEANALPAAVGDDILIDFAAADVLGGDEITLPNAGPVATTTRYTTQDRQADWTDISGSYFLIDAQRPVTIDFDGRIKLMSNGDAERAAITIKSADVTLTNFANIRAGASGIQVAGPNATISHGVMDDSATDWQESGIVLTDGADGTVIDDVEFIDQAAFGIYVDDGATVVDTTLSNSRFSDGRRYGDIWVEFGVNADDPTQIDGFHVTNSTFSSDAINSTIGFREYNVINDMVVEDSTFNGENEYAVYSHDARVTTNGLVLRNNEFTDTAWVWTDSALSTHTDLQIVDNTFTGQLNHSLVMRLSNHVDNVISGNEFLDQRGAPEATIWLTRQAARTDAGNVIERNTFIQSESAPANRWAIYAEMEAPAVGEPTGWEFSRNHIDGYDGSTQAPITVGPNKVTTKIWGNTFGPRTDGTTDAEEAEGGTQWFLWNTGSHNNRVQTWRPGDTYFRDGKVSFTAAPVDPALSNNQQPVGVVNLYVYWTADDKAEEYLGKITGAAAGQRYMLDTAHTSGVIRFQTEDADGNFSQYSGVAEIVDWNTLDDDGDGLTNGREVELGTDPANPDTDDDGLSDGVEVNTHQTDPKVKDTDGDGLEDGAEVNTHQTDPTEADTDGDGLSDGAEVSTHQTDPLKADTDGDGLSDGAEVSTHKTKPTVADTDGDGLSDGAEVRGPGLCVTGTDPLVVDTDGDSLSDGAEVAGFTLAQKVRTRAGTAPIGLVPTNPCAADTDADGLTDAEEVNGFTMKTKVYPKKGKQGKRIGKVVTNPVNPDTDGDGLSDLKEKKGSKTKRYGKRPSNPVDYDTDGGGASDGKELRKKADPTRYWSGPNKP